MFLDLRFHFLISSNFCHLISHLLSAFNIDVGGGLDDPKGLYGEDSVTNAALLRGDTITSSDCEGLDMREQWDSSPLFLSIFSHLVSCSWGILFCLPRASTRLLCFSVVGKQQGRPITDSTKTVSGINLVYELIHLGTNYSVRKLTLYLNKALPLIWSPY